MKSVLAIALAMITSSMALAAKPAVKTPVDPCEKNAQIASQKILRAFGWSRGIQPMQVVLSDEKTDETGAEFKSYTTGMFFPIAQDGYMRDTGVTVKMVKTSAGCEVEEVSLSTGAAFQEELAKEVKKMEADFKRK